MINVLRGKKMTTEDFNLSEMIMEMNCPCCDIKMICPKCNLPMRDEYSYLTTLDVKEFIRRLKEEGFFIKDSDKKIILVEDINILAGEDLK